MCGSHLIYEAEEFFLKMSQCQGNLRHHRLRQLYAGEISDRVRGIHMSQSNPKEDVKNFEYLMSSTDSFMLSRQSSAYEYENIPTQSVWPVGQPSHQKMS